MDGMTHLYQPIKKTIKMKNITILILIFQFGFLHSQQIKRIIDIQEEPGKFKTNVTLDVEFDYDFDKMDLPKKTFEEFIALDKLIQEGEKEKALVALEKLKSEKIDDFTQSLLKAFAFVQLNEMEKSIETFEESIQLTEKDSMKSLIYYGIGIIYLSNEMVRNAYYNLEASHALDTNNLITVLALSEIIGPDEKDKKMRFMEKALSLDPELHYISNKLGFHYLEEGQYVQAEKKFSDLLEKSPGHPLALNNRSFCKMKSGQLKEALKDVNRSIEIYPENSYAFRNRAYIYIEMKNIKSACKDIEKAMELGYTDSYGFDLTITQMEYCKE